MPTRCNRGFYYSSYCLRNMFQAPLCPSSGAQEYYTVVAACSILQTGHITLSSTPDQQLENHSMKYHRQQPLYNTLELLMMGIVVPENIEQAIRSAIKKNPLLHLVDILFLHINFFNLKKKIVPKKESFAWSWYHHQHLTPTVLYPLAH